MKESKIETKELNSPDLNKPKREKDEERESPKRKYSVLEDGRSGNFIENGQKIETF